LTDVPGSAPVRTRGFILAMVVVACFATAFLLATPGFVLLMAAQWNYGIRQLGLFVTADSIGNAMGPLLLSGGLSRLPVRRIVIPSALCFAAGNVLTALHPAFDWILASRVVSGTSGGVLAALGVRYLALSAASERNLAWMTIGQTLYATAILMGVLPAFGQAARADAAFALLALQGLLCLPLFMLFRSGEPLTAHLRSTGVAHRAGALLCLFAILSLNAAAGVVWTFLGRQGLAAGLSDAQVDRVLGGANLLSIAGCAWAPFVVRRGKLFAGCIGSLALCAASSLALAFPPQAWLFAGASVVYVVAWASAITLMMTAVPAYDPVGRYVMLIPAAVCMGNGIGATIGATLTQALTAGHAFVFASGCCMLAAAVFLALSRRASGALHGVSVTR
jgi:predicted MFS family arabinose efflux permease